MNRFNMYGVYYGFLCHNSRCGSSLMCVGGGGGYYRYAWLAHLALTSLAWERSLWLVPAHGAIGLSLCGPPRVLCIKPRTWLTAPGPPWKWFGGSVALNM